MEKINKEQTPLDGFLQKFEKIPAQIIDALLKVTEDEDEKNVINSFAPAFTDQFTQLSRVASEKAAMTTRQGFAEVEQFLRVSSANNLADNLSIALPSIGSVIGKLGIVGIVQEIKKIVRKLFELLKKTLPVWLDAAFLLIDEILNHLFGGDSPKMRATLHGMELALLGEELALTNLERASLFKYQVDEDED